jgi:cysteinyl-tRNA synthetase
LKLYNTLSSQIDQLQHTNNTIRIYVCGVTVYDDSHIGHARTIIFFDVLRRYLRYKGYNVKYIQNFTDIDDKIINRAKQEGLNPREIAKRYMRNYLFDFNSLNVLEADNYPLATDHIPEIIDFINILLEKGYAYITPNGVYFHVKSFSNYGKLSKKTIVELETGHRIEIDPLKRDPLDFALWKFYSEEPVWSSPWGAGRPGWHIECSVMASKYLGSSFEIHGGGSDLIFPHHENEIAQSESMSGRELAKLWLHVGMVSINAEKMSKSLGNIVTVRNAIDRWGINALRIYAISVHYSKPLDYGEKLVLACLQKWRQIEVCAYELRLAVGKGGEIEKIRALCHDSAESFERAMENDMNTALALNIFMKFVNQLNRYAATDQLTRDMSYLAMKPFNQFMDVLGLKLAEPSEEEQKQIENLLKERNKLREERKFSDSDVIRKRLNDQFSVRLMDHKNRTVWMKFENTSNIVS